MDTNYDDDKNIMIVFVCLRFLIFFIVTQEQLILQEIFKYFRTFHIIFRMFSNVFERFFLPILPKPHNLTSQPPFLPQKPTCPRKTTSKNPILRQITIFLVLNFANLRKKNELFTQPIYQPDVSL